MRRSLLVKLGALFMATFIAGGVALVIGILALVWACALLHHKLEGSGGGFCEREAMEDVETAP